MSYYIGLYCISDVFIILTVVNTCIVLVSVSLDKQM